MVHYVVDYISPCAQELVSSAGSSLSVELRPQTLSFDACVVDRRSLDCTSCDSLGRVEVDDDATADEAGIHVDPHGDECGE